MHCEGKLKLRSHNTLLPIRWFMVFNATFNNISVIWWQSVLLVEETEVPGENYMPATSHRQTLSHNVVSSTPLNYHSITTTMLIIRGGH